MPPFNEKEITLNPGEERTLVGVDGITYHIRAAGRPTNPLPGDEPTHAIPRNFSPYDLDTRVRTAIRKREQHIFMIGAYNTLHGAHELLSPLKVLPGRTTDLKSALIVHTYDQSAINSTEVEDLKSFGAFGWSININGRQYG
jgi:hypothetical protein